MLTLSLKSEGSDSIENSALVREEEELHEGFDLLEVRTGIFFDCKYGAGSKKGSKLDANNVSLYGGQSYCVLNIINCILTKHGPFT